MVRVGLLTIGQSPRVDILTDWEFRKEQIENFKSMGKLVPPSGSPIPENIEFVHLGALDDIPPERMHEIQPPEGKSGMISRLKNGSWILIDPEKIKPLMINSLERLEEAGCEAILQLCTGGFNYLQPNVLYLKAGTLCRSLIESILKPSGKLGAFHPFPSRSGPRMERSERWGGREVFSVNANPYDPPPESIVPAIEEMKKHDVDLAYMGCLGYGLAHKKIAMEILEKPVILPRSVSARTLAELFGV